MIKKILLSKIFARFSLFFCAGAMLAYAMIGNFYLCFFWALLGGLKFWSHNLKKDY